MTDNTVLNPGIGGDTIGSDDIAGIKYQRVKLIVGVDGTNDGDIAKTNPLPVTSIATTFSDHSGTITTGNTAQTLLSANTNRKGFLIVNNSNASLWFSATTTAVLTHPSIEIPPGALYESMPNCCPSNAISIIGATTGQVFTCWEG